MDWLLIALVILLVEVVIVALFWEKISETFASYTHLYEKAVRLSENKETKRAIETFNKMLTHPKMQEIEEENPLKQSCNEHLARLYEQLVDESEEGSLEKLGEQELKRALQYKVRELKAKGTWEQVGDSDPDIIRLRLKLATVYTANKSNLTEAMETFFRFNKWKAFKEAYSYYSKTSEYFKLGRIDKESVEDRLKFVDAIMMYQEGNKDMLAGDETGEKLVENALKEFAELIAIRPELMYINDPVFNEAKTKLGHDLVEDLVADHDETDAEVAVAEEEQGEAVKQDAKGIKGTAPLPLTGDNWKRIAARIYKVSRVISDVQHTGAEVNIKVQTEWYLLPLIFKEELVEKVVQSYYASTLKKEGSVLFVFKDDKGREVARHTILGIKIYN